MKKGIEWLNMMKRKEQVLFLKNLVTYGPAEFEMNEKRQKHSIFSYLNREFLSFEEFITNSFDWESTPEGHDWWWDYAKYKRI